MAYDHNYGSLFISPSTQDHIQGERNASVMLVMYGDYECFQSANTYRLIKVAQQQLSASFRETGLSFIFRHFPQVQIHPYAQRAAEAAEAAAAQGQFWQMHEMLFIHQQELGDGYLVEYGNRLGLDMSQFLRDLSRGTYVDCVNADIEGGLQSGVEAAPALFINGIRYIDRWTINKSWQQLLRLAINGFDADFSNYFNKVSEFSPPKSPRLCVPLSPRLPHLLLNTQSRRFNYAHSKYRQNHRGRS